MSYPFLISLHCNQPYRIQSFFLQCVFFSNEFPLYRKIITKNSIKIIFFQIQYFPFSICIRGRRTNTIRLTLIHNQPLCELYAMGSNVLLLCHSIQIVIPLPLPLPLFLIMLLSSSRSLSSSVRWCRPQLVSTHTTSAYGYLQNTIHFYQLN